MGDDDSAHRHDHDDDRDGPAQRHAPVAPWERGMTAGEQGNDVAGGRPGGSRLPYRESPDASLERPRQPGEMPGYPNGRSQPPAYGDERGHGRHPGRSGEYAPDGTFRSEPSEYPHPGPGRSGDTGRPDVYSRPGWSGEPPQSGPGRPGATGRPDDDFRPGDPSRPGGMPRRGGAGEDPRSGSGHPGLSPQPGLSGELPRVQLPGELQRQRPLPTGPDGRQGYPRPGDETRPVSDDDGETTRYAPPFEGQRPARPPRSAPGAGQSGEFPMQRPGPPARPMPGSEGQPIHPRSGAEPYPGRSMSNVDGEPTRYAQPFDGQRPAQPPRPASGSAGQSGEFPRQRPGQPGQPGDQRGRLLPGAENHPDGSLPGAENYPGGALPGAEGRPRGSVSGADSRLGRPLPGDDETTRYLPAPDEQGRGQSPHATPGAVEGRPGQPVRPGPGADDRTGYREPGRSLPGAGNQPGRPLPGPDDETTRYLPGFDGQRPAQPPRGHSAPGSAAASGEFPQQRPGRAARPAPGSAGQSGEFAQQRPALPDASAEPTRYPAGMDPAARQRPAQPPRSAAAFHDGSGEFPNQVPGGQVPPGERGRAPAGGTSERRNQPPGAEFGDRPQRRPGQPPRPAGGAQSGEFAQPARPGTGDPVPRGAQSGAIPRQTRGEFDGRPQHAERPEAANRSGAPGERGYGVARPGEPGRRGGAARGSYPGMPGPPVDRRDADSGRRRPAVDELAAAKTQRIARPQPVATEKPATPQSANAKLLKDSGSIAIATLISRITGFAKQLLLLTVLGPAVASAFISANLIPNMIAELVLGAVLTAIVVPTLVRAEQEDADGGAAFVRRLVTAAFAVLFVATVLTLAATPILAGHVLVDSDGKVDTNLTIALTYLLAPAILFYGMSALFTAILNTRQAFKPGAWAPVLNNLVALTVLAAYALTPGEITFDPVRMSDPKLLVLGIGITAGVATQAFSLLPAIRRHGINLRPLWGVDTRLKQFGKMGAAIILYVLISQTGLVVANNIASAADEAGPAIFANAWALLQLPYGVLGVTLLTAIMPRLSRNAAADDTPAVVDDLSVATRLTMIALIPVVTFMTLAGPTIGEALYGYARFSGDAERLGAAVSWSAFSLIPYSLVLIHLRVFYAREQAWTPTWIILGITTIKILFSALAPVLARDSDDVVIILGVATGLGFTAGAVIGGVLLHRSLGDLRMSNVGRTVTRVLLASVAGGAVMLIVDTVTRMDHLTGGPASLLRVMVGALVMFSVAFGLMRLAGIPEVVAITVAISRKLGITPPAPDLGLDDTPSDDIYATTVLRRPDTYAFPAYGHSMDTQTMVLPVIRPGAVDITGQAQFPYAVRQTDGDYQAEGGPRVSDDAVGGVPAADSAARAAGGMSTDVSPAAADKAGSAPDDAPEDSENTQVAGPADDEHDDAHAAVPPHDPTHDTGMLPIPPQVPAAANRAQRGPKLIPGASVAGGRYRLLASHGGARGLKFWQALDIKLDREVALTFVDADQKSGENSGHDGPQAILSRTLRLGRINSPGLARVLDVVRGSSGGIVVAEWTPGRSLREMAETVPSPIGAARAIRALASAAELAHRGGGSLSIDHPDRIRISASGDAVLAFPGTLGDSDAQSDVRGLGAMLYALITARWPIRVGGVTGTAATIGGLRLADFGPDGTPVEPRQIRPEVPFEISAVAVRSLESNKGVRTAATVQHVLEQASVVDQKTDFIPVLRLGQRAVAGGPDSLADPELLAAERERSKRMMWIMVGLGVLAALVVGILIWWMVSIFAPGASDKPLDEQINIGLTSSVAPPSAAAVPAEETSVAPPTSVPVPVTGAAVFSPEGTPDGAATAGAVLDQNPATVWRTDQYFQQFPALKKGVGLLATLPTPAKLTNVSITSPSAGSTVEIRTSPTEAPTLDQTQLIGSAKLGEGVTDIAVQTDQAARFVLVWITGLANSGGQFQTAIADVRLDAAP